MGTDKDVSYSLSNHFDLIPEGRPMNTINVTLMGFCLSIRAHPRPSVVQKSLRPVKKPHGSGTEDTEGEKGEFVEVHPQCFAL